MMKMGKIAALIVASLSVAGCQSSREPEPTIASPTTLAASEKSTKTKDQLIAEADALVAGGKAMKERALKMSTGEMYNGLSKNDLLIKSDKQIANGMAMKQRAMAR